jgi:DNA-binding CsgD family transcriptional regulator
MLNESCIQGYNLESLHLKTLENLPGFIYIKSRTSDYLWTNLNLAKRALGVNNVNALKDATDFDFHWSLFAKQMQENDRRVIQTRKAVHANELCQRPDGKAYRLITYKIPLYKNRKLSGLIGVSYERHVNRIQLRLTPREQNCIALMMQGLSDKDIANRLNISRRTVETYFNSSKIKMDVKSRAELIVLFCDEDKKL